jgi:hypothetical protein
MAQKKKGLGRSKLKSAVGKPARPQKSTATKSKKKGKGPRKKGPRKSGPALGRPKVTGEELLFMLFKEDYHARQIFDFLRVEKVKDLEQYSPQQIVRLLSRPITQTVDRIRRKLAEKNRCLRDDAEFATQVKANE